jgi:hypothetical protein
MNTPDSGLNSGGTGLNSIQTPPKSAQSPPNVAIPPVMARKPGSVKREVLETRRTIRRLKKAFREANRDISKRGVEIFVTVTDSEGVSFTKPGVNPSLRVQRESDRSIKVLTKHLAALQVEFLELSTKHEGDAMSWLDAPETK